MGTITTAGTLFNSELVSDVFKKVKGHSTLAKLCGAMPITFAGVDSFIFTMDGEASIVGEGANKPAGNAEYKSITIKPVKVVYQHRISDEFINLAEEKQVPYLENFTDGFSKKIARAVDIMAFHGVNPATNAASGIIGTNCFDSAITEAVPFAYSTPDDVIDTAVSKITDDGTVTGIAMSPAFASALGSMKTASEHVSMYPEFRFGANPANFGSLASDVNTTVNFGNNGDMAIVGDFANAFKWGYAENIPMEIIQFGDPDGQGDLKRTNQIVLRAEAYVGWGILDPFSFCRIVNGNGTTTETFIGDGTTTEFTVSHTVASEVSVTVNGTAVTSGVTRSGKKYTFTAAPSAGDIIRITYTYAS